MPMSSAEGKMQISRFFSVLGGSGAVRRCLDIGPGQGAYASLLRRYAPTAEWVGIEVFAPYVEKYDLRRLYDAVHVADARIVDYARLGRFDVCFCGDVLEHMSPEDAVDLLTRLQAQADIVVISIPIVHMPQDGVEDNAFEAHVKDDWSHEEVMATLPNIVGSWAGEVIGVYVTAATGIPAFIARTAWQQAIDG